MIDPDIELFTYHNTKTGEVRYFSEEEEAEQPDANDWRQGRADQDGRRTAAAVEQSAQELGVASHTSSTASTSSNNCTGSRDDPRVAEPNWALELVEALSSPALAVLLLVIGVCRHLHRAARAGHRRRRLSSRRWRSCCSSGATFCTARPAGWKCCCSWAACSACCWRCWCCPASASFGLGGGAMILASLVLASQTFVLPQDRIANGRAAAFAHDRGGRDA